MECLMFIQLQDKLIVTWTDWNEEKYAIIFRKTVILALHKQIYFMIVSYFPISSSLKKKNKLNKKKYIYLF